MSKGLKLTGYHYDLQGPVCSDGCTDCSELKWTDLDIVNARVKLPRKKTGILRDLLLWPETIEALKRIPKTGALVFYTSKVIENSRKYVIYKS